MQCIRKLSDYKGSQRSAVTFGKFDGLHEGHQLLIQKVKELSEAENLNSIVCAFDMQRLWEDRGIQPQVLMTRYERHMHLENVVDNLVTCPFTPEFSQVEAEDFIENVICGLFHAKYVVVGPDFHFGRAKRGDTQMLKDYASVYDYEVFIIEKKRYADREISSTYIREALREGAVSKVNEMLGYPFEISGTVMHGRQLGRTLGFPTMNVQWPRVKVVPPMGVYMVNVFLEGKCYHAVANIGVKPTVTNENKVSIESFLFDYDGDAYDKEVRIELLEFRRPEKKFDSVEIMKENVDKDIAYAKSYFGI
jgi:riboflavin kinase/FMN adenylyltransferase